MGAEEFPAGLVAKIPGFQSLVGQLRFGKPWAWPKQMKTDGAATLR